MQLALPGIGWTPPETRGMATIYRLVQRDERITQVTIAEWLWAFGYPDDAEKFCAIPQEIQLAKAQWGFTQTEARVLDAILLKQFQWWRHRGKPHAMGSADFKFITHLDRRTIRNGLRSLEEMRIIRVTRRGRGRRSLYSVNAPEAWCRKSSSTRRRAAPTYIGALS